MRIVFMGTPDFAVASLSAIYDAGFEICGVYTQPDKAKNRGMKFTFSPVKEYAVSKGIPVFQPKSLKKAEAAEEIRSLKPDIIVVVAYGRLLTQEILDIPPLGVINVHGSLLPKYRGSAPIQWAVINGEEKTGVATMYMALQLDSGDVIDIAEAEIGKDETYGELYGRLKDLGAELLVKTLNDIGNGSVKRYPQDEQLVTYAPPIQKEHCPINWNKTANEIVNQIRGLNPKPCAAASFGGTDFKIHRAEKGTADTKLEPGKIISADKKGLLVACGNGETVLITELQAAGGKRMAVSDYLLGHNIDN